MKKYGIIGYPVGHSFSPTIHNTAFKHYSVNAEYSKIEIEKSVFDSKIIELKKENWNGFNVTSPYKKQIIPHLDELETICSRIDAVNTIKIDKNGNWEGYNTDYIGFIKPIQSFLDKIDTCLLIGAGGAAQAVGFSLLEFSTIRKFVVIDLVKKHAETLIHKLKSFSVKEYEIIDFKMINDIAGSFDLIVNMSPVGMGSLKDQSPLSIINISHSDTIVYDLIYNPSQTLFLKEAKEVGLKTINGLPMLIGQAEESFKIWTGKKFPDTVKSELGAYLSN